MRIKDVDLITETKARIRIKRGLLWKWAMVNNVGGYWKLPKGDMDIHDQIVAALLSKSLCKS